MCWRKSEIGWVFGPAIYPSRRCKVCGKDTRTPPRRRWWNTKHGSAR